MTSNNAYLDGRAKGLEWAKTRDDPLARPTTEETVAAARPVIEPMTVASDKIAFYSGFAEGAFESWFFHSIDLLDFPEELKPNRSPGWLAQLEVPAGGRVDPAIGIPIRHRPRRDAKITLDRVE